MSPKTITTASKQRLIDNSSAQTQTPTAVTIKKTPALLTAAAVKTMMTVAVIMGAPGWFFCPAKGQPMGMLQPFTGS